MNKLGKTLIFCLACILSSAGVTQAASVSPNGQELFTAQITIDGSANVREGTFKCYVVCDQSTLGAVGSVTALAYKETGFACYKTSSNSDNSARDALKGAAIASAHAVGDISFTKC